MRRLFILSFFSFSLSLVLSCVVAYGQTGHGFKWVEASELTLAGKVFNDTPNPYHRIDTCKYKGWTQWQNYQVRCSTGMSVFFRTDSPSIRVLTDYAGFYRGQTTNILSHKGFDLYIKKDGKWLYAGSGVEKYNSPGTEAVIVENMDSTMKECLLYLPIYSEENSIKIGVHDGSTLQPMDSPFRHRLLVYGSSYTHGVCTSRAGMCYPAIFTRKTGIQTVSLAMSGQCKMQEAAIAALIDAPDVDAFLFDTFSNPDAQMIKERLFNFIERIQKAHPGKPMIFQQTIYREMRNFNQKENALEQAKMDMAAKLMKQACKKYKDVYFIEPNPIPSDHESQVDAIHPNDYGYQMWEQSIEKKVLKILRKYGIR